MIWIFHQPQDVNLISALLPLLPEPIQAEVHSCASLKTAWQKAVSRRLLQLALKEQGIFHSLQMQKDAAGRPWLFGRPDLFFSITHAENFVALALEKENIGIDGEKIAAIFPQGAEKRAFTLQERRCFPLAKDKFRLWVMKESYAKWAGKSMLQANAFPLDAIHQKGEDCFFSLFELQEIIFAACMASPHSISLKMMRSEQLIFE